MTVFTNVPQPEGEMCPGSLLGSSWLQSRGQAQAAEWVYPHSKLTGSQNQQKLACSETGMPHPQGKVCHCSCLFSSGESLLALDLRG